MRSYEIAAKDESAKAGSAVWSAGLMRGEPILQPVGRNANLSMKPGRKPAFPKTSKMKVDSDKLLKIKA
jgi:hypothetical protein